MSRSIWAAAGASVLAFALTPGAALAAGGGSSAARPGSAHAKQNTHPGRRPSAIRRLRHSAVRAGAQRHFAVPLAPGSGYQHAAGSARVRALQRQLARSGNSPGFVDGRYGPLTTQAIERFQGAHRLQVDGIAGPVTLAALSAPTPLFPGTGYQPGGSGRVRALQRQLARAGDTPGPIDGHYGPLTEHAVQRFQATHGLQIDGIAGPQTITHLHPQTPIQVRSQAPSHPQSRPRPARPNTPFRPAAAARPATHVHHANHSSGRSLESWLVLLGGLTLALLLALEWHTRERRTHTRSDRFIPEPPAGSTAEHALRLKQRANVLLSQAQARLAAEEQQNANQRDGASPAPRAEQNGAPVVGYASVSEPGGVGRRELKQQAEAIERECERLGLELLEVIGEREPTNNKRPDRPGLAYALERISTHEARGLVVAELARLSNSAAELDTIIETLDHSNAQLLTAAHPPHTTTKRRPASVQAPTNHPRPRHPTPPPQRRGHREERGT